MNILLCITGMTLGGAERQVANLADRFAAAGHTCNIVVLGGDIEVRPASPQVGLFHLGMRRKPLSAVAALFAFRRLCRELAPQIVHSHLFHANLLCRLSWFLFRTPKPISSLHNSRETSSLRYSLYSATRRWARLTTNVSSRGFDEYFARRAVDRRSSLVVYNGIELAGEGGAAVPGRASGKSAGLRLISVGRLTGQKDFTNLLRAFALLRQNRPDLNTSLQIVGDGELRADLEALAAHLELRGAVTFLGARDDVPALLRSANIYVQSSAWEGFGMAIAEAMDAGLPVVSTDCGGPAEVLDGLGRLVPPGNSGALAAAIAATADDVAAGRFDPAPVRASVAARFSYEAAAAAWLEIYGSFVPQRAPA